MPRLLLALLLAAPALAQEAPFVALPDSVVVTATRLPAEARATGHHVTVLTAAEIAALPSHGLQEVLRTAGGVEVQARGGFGVQADLTLRGAPFNGVLVLVDGARFNDPMTGHFLTDLPLPLAELARIEVLRGPAAAAYGPDAVGGVIHLITHAGLGRSGPPEADAHLLGGTVGTAVLGAAARWGQRTEATFAVEGARSDGEPIVGEAGPVVGPAGPVRTDFARVAASGALARSIGPARLYGRLGADRRDFSAYQFYTPFPVDTAREATSTLWAQARLDAPLAEGTDLRLHVSARQHEDEYVFNPQTPANRHTSRRATALAELRRSGPVNLAAGLSADLRGIESNNLGTHADASAGVFLAAQRAGPRAALAAGLRLDADPGYGLEPTGTLSGAYTPSPRLTLRAAAGRAVRAPTYVERYLNTTLARPRGRNVGNPDLRAETAWTAEAGADLFPTPGLTLRATAFLRDTRDLIDFARLTPADTVFLAQNVLRVRTGGVEADVRLRRALRRGRTLTLDGGYTLLESALSGGVAGAEYKYALTHARHRVSGGAALAAGPLRAALQGVATRRLDGSGFAVADVRAGYAVPVPRAELVLTAEVHNVLDARYTEVFGAPMPGRRLLAGLRVRSR